MSDISDFIANLDAGSSGVSMSPNEYPVELGGQGSPTTTEGAWNALPSGTDLFNMPVISSFLAGLPKSGESLSPVMKMAAMEDPNINLGGAGSMDPVSDMVKQMIGKSAINPANLTPAQEPSLMEKMEEIAKKYPKLLSLGSGALTLMLAAMQKQKKFDPNEIRGMMQSPYSNWTPGQQAVQERWNKPIDWYNTSGNSSRYIPQPARKYAEGGLAYATGGATRPPSGFRQQFNQAVNQWLGQSNPSHGALGYGTPRVQATQQQLWDMLNGTFKDVYGADFDQFGQGKWKGDTSYANPKVMSQLADLRTGKGIRDFLSNSGIAAGSVFDPTENKWVQMAPGTRPNGTQAWGRGTFNSLDDEANRSVGTTLQQKMFEKLFNPVSQYSTWSDDPYAVGANRNSLGLNNISSALQKNIMDLYGSKENALRYDPSLRNLWDKPQDYLSDYKPDVSKFSEMYSQGLMGRDNVVGLDPLFNSEAQKRMGNVVGSDPYKQYLTEKLAQSGNTNLTPAQIIADQQARFSGGQYQDLDSIFDPHDDKSMQLSNNYWSMNPNQAQGQRPSATSTGEHMFFSPRVQPGVAVNVDPQSQQAYDRGANPNALPMAPQQPPNSFSPGFAGGGEVGALGMARHSMGHRGPVSGPGKGQDDKIPALLSDGEYVIDADTVAALGDGSNKAGADALDNMRVKIRQHKRGAPASKIPPKAKSPERYLKGGK